MVGRTEFLPGGLYFQQQFPGRHTARALPEDDHLFEAVGGRDGDIALLSDFMYSLFNVGVCSFRLLRVNNIDVMVTADRTSPARHLIRIKNQNQGTGSCAVEVAHNVDQTVSCGIHAGSRKAAEFFSAEDDVVSVNQQIILLLRSDSGDSGALIFAGGGLFTS